MIDADDPWWIWARRMPSSPTRAMLGNARRRELMAQVEARTRVTHFYEAHGVTISRTYSVLGQEVSPWLRSTPHRPPSSRRCAGLPDLLVGIRGETFLLEVKVLKGKKNPRPDSLSIAQRQWHRDWRGHPVSVVATPEQALRAVGLL